MANRHSPSGTGRARPRPEIERALGYIADHLEHPITVADIARAANLSEFHLHRVFHAALGESVGKFLTRKRLETAALHLAYQPDRPITDIALSSGYSSLSNFSKAFSSYFGCSPSRIRSPDGQVPGSLAKIFEQYGPDFRIEALYTLPPDPVPEELHAAVDRWNESARHVDSAGHTFACLASPEGYDLDGLDATWNELIERCSQLGICSGDVDAWGMAHDSPQLTAPERCRYHACIPCPADMRLPAPLFLGEMKPGRYAVFGYSGPVQSMVDAYRSLYSCWFRDSSVVPADFTPLDHYITDEPRNGHVELEIWIRTQPRR